MIIKAQRERESGRKVVFFERHHSGKLLIALSADSIDDCPSNCFGNGDCVSGTCHCFLGFKGPDCGRGESPCFRHKYKHLLYVLTVLANEYANMHLPTKPNG